MKGISRKNKKNTAEEIKDIVEPIKVEDKVDTEIVDDFVEAENNIEIKDSEKTICRILVAKPSYFVVSKNGKEILVTEKNNYKRGEDILF